LAAAARHTSWRNTIGDETERACQRGYLLNRRRKLMGAWAAYCSRPAATGEVVPYAADEKARIGRPSDSRRVQVDRLIDIRVLPDQRTMLWPLGDTTQFNPTSRPS